MRHPCGDKLLAYSSDMCNSESPQKSGPGQLVPLKLKANLLTVVHGSASEKVSFLVVFSRFLAGVGAVHSSGHRLIWWGDAMSICNNPMLHRTILCKSITFAYVHLRGGNKSKLGLEA